VFFLRRTFQCIVYHLNSADDILTAPTTERESRYKLPGPAVRKGTRGLTMFMFLSFLVLQLFVNLQIHPFRPGPSNSAIDSHPYRFRTQSFSRSAFTGGTENIFSPMLEPHSVSPHPKPSFTPSARCMTFWQRVTAMHPFR
jgi:hypothetical protein